MLRELTSEEQELMKDAMLLWGKDSQIDMLVEECAELIHTIQKLKRVRHEGKEEETEYVQQKVADEMADVVIMINQMNYIFKTFDFEKCVEIKMKEKFERLKGRIEKSNIMECIDGNKSAF